MDGFTVYPAIDLRGGQVVRLAQGDPDRQTTYGTDPAEAARRWLDEGTLWLHVVNLDGAFEDPDQANRRALEAILKTTEAYQPTPLVQFGGGMRSLGDIEQALAAGVSRVVVGTAAVRNPKLVDEALRRFGPERVAVGLDARDGKVMVRGWTEDSEMQALAVARRYADMGLCWIVFTDIARDGVGTGVNIASTKNLGDESGLQVIASGGVHTLDDIRQVKQAGLTGVIVGRALYEGNFKLQEALSC